MHDFYDKSIKYQLGWMIYNSFMQYLISKLLNLEIASFQDWAKIGTATEYLLNKEKLKIDIVRVKKKNDKNYYYLTANDIRSINEKLLIVDSAQDLSGEDDLVRYKGMIAENIILLGSKVIDEDGKKIGNVKDYTIDYNSLEIIKLHIKTNWLNRLINERLIVDKSDVKNVTKNTITIRNGKKKIKQKATKVLPAQEA